VYKRQVPDLAQFGYSTEHDDLWLVDFSYKAHDMDKLASAAGQHQNSQVSRLVWIDHHVTSLNALEGFEWLPGVRYAGLAACMLTWRYLNGPDMPPWPLRFIADRDIWRFQHGDLTRHFYERYLLEDSRPESGIWDVYFDFFDLNNEEFKTYLAQGEVLRNSRIKALRSAVRRFGYEVPVSDRGQVRRALMINYPGSGDMGEVVKEMGFDLTWAYTYFKRNKDLVKRNNLYSAVMDVGAYCAARGGGGHRGAAGFDEISSLDPWV
jgi:oligoribonuclease NrnB/cAMP/cGMP phosphodiesterase (DHH superfamily)